MATSTRKSMDKLGKRKKLEDQSLDEFLTGFTASDSNESVESTPKKSKKNNKKAKKPTLVPGKKVSKKKPGKGEDKHVGVFASHKSSLDKLKEQDPEFYEFLQKEDESLLKFDVSDSDFTDTSDDGEESDAGSDSKADSDDEEMDIPMSSDDDDDAEEKGMNVPKVKNLKGKKEGKEKAVKKKADEVSQKKLKAKEGKEKKKGGKKKAEEVTADIDDVETDSDSDEEMYHQPPETLEEAEDSDDEGEGDADKGKQGIKVTLSMVDQWTKRFKEQPSPALIATVAQVLKAAVQKTSRESEETKYSVVGGSVFNAVVRMCLVEMPPALHKLLDLQTTTNLQKPVLPSVKDKRWIKVKSHVKFYLKDILKLMSDISEVSMVNVLLKHILKLVAFYACDTKLVKMLLKKAISIWSTGEETSRVLAFLIINRLIKVNAGISLEDCIKKLYMAYVRNCKFTSPNTLPLINFMQRSFVEIISLDVELAYQYAFMYIRQLAIHLRNATATKKKESCQAVYNWQYVHCIVLWSRVMSMTYPNEVLEPLIYPLVQTIIGTIKLIPTQRYYPLRFHCVQALTMISKATNIYIPVLPFLLEDQVFNMEPVSDCYRKKCINGENVYFCMLCGRSLSRKQRMQSHLVAIHNKSPFKRQKKRYLDDSSVPVPKRTIRWQEKRKKDSLRYQVDLNINEENEVMIDSPVELDNRCNLQEEDVHKTPACSTGELAEAMLPQTMEYSSDSGSSYDKDSFVEQDSTEESSIDRSTDSSDSDFSDGDMSDNDEKCHTPNDSKKMLSACESQAFCLVSFILKHNLSASAGKDLLNLLQTLCPESEYFNKLKYEHLLKDASDHEPKVVHYCSVCQNRFPDDPDVIYCTISDCSGLRYVGPLSSQTLSNREPRCCFVIADIQSQLCSLIERNHIWNTIQDTKRSIILGDAPSFITDIKDGEAYRIHCHPGGCLYDQNALSAIFNTDGVPLFNSSKIKLWPIFICINELPPSQRFARENTILAALWQGKDKPPFFQYISAFGDEMSKLHLDGFYAKPRICVDPIHVHLTVLLASVDLQAKAYVTNMTMHNGSYGCITCEEKGVNVKQGKGYSHYYPYRQTHEKPVMRDSNDVKYIKAFQASKKKRVIGITGVSGILALECFDMVQGMVPDYMLLGVTKTLLNKWFSPTQSGKPYFMGKHINSISKRMSNIKPPDYIERLPRNLEKNYNHFKATELQTWLLYYALPCLVGYLGYDYLEHFACFSEGIHILLRDRISQPELDRAQTLLDTFYRDFANLYGEGSCGLNVHNIGSHLVHYVRLWGPLYGWSCFGFEDSNAELLNAIHGTGNVLKPVLKMKQVQFKIWSLDLTSFEKPSEMQFLSKMVPKWRKRWKKLTKCENCYICGAPTTCQFENDQKEFFLQKTKATSVHDLRKVKRVKVNDQYLYCKEYSRMNQRICHVVLCENDKRYSVEYFLLNKTSNTVYAVGKIIEVEEQIHICQSAGHHLLRVKLTLDIQIFEVDKIKEKLFYMTPCENTCVIGQVPNQHGHGVFK